MATIQNLSGKGHKDLRVWQQSMDLVIEIYKLTESFPQNENFGLTTQMRRCAASIPANLSEGSKRGTRRSFRSFVLIAYGSGAELETHLEIVRRLHIGNSKKIEEIDASLQIILRMLHNLARTLKAPMQKNHQQ